MVRRKLHLLRRTSAQKTTKLAPNPSPPSPKHESVICFHIWIVNQRRSDVFFYGFWKVEFSFFLDKILWIWHRSSLIHLDWCFSKEMKWTKALNDVDLELWRDVKLFWSFFFYLFRIETFWFVQIHITLVSPLFLMRKNWEETFFVYDVDLIDFSFGFKGVFWFSNFLKPKRFLSLSSTSFSSDWISLWSLWEKRGVWSYTWGFNGDSG